MFEFGNFFFAQGNEIVAPTIATATAQRLGASGDIRLLLLGARLLVA